VRAHCTYRAPVQWQHSTGISFLGVDGAPTLDVVRCFAEAMHYTGQLSFDFAVVAELFEEPLRQSPATIHDLLHVRDVGEVGGTTCRWSGRSPRSCTAPA